MSRRFLLGAPLSILAWICVAVPSYAADLVVDSTDLALTASSPATVEVAVLNVSDREISFTPMVADQPGCSVSASPASVKAGRREAVTFTFVAGCNTANGVTLAISETPVAGPPLVVAKAPSGVSPVRGLMWGFSLSILSLVLLAVWVGRELGKVKTELNSPEEANRRTKDNERLKARIKEAVTLVTGKPPEDNSLPNPTAAPALQFGTELENLEAGWSFKDSWVVNLNIGSAAFVALLSSTDILTAVLGAEPKKALGTMALAVGCAALLIALATTLVKVVGDDLKKPTVGGLLISAALVSLATNGQIGTLAFEAFRLAPSTSWKIAIVTLAIAVASIVGWYSVRSIKSLVSDGLEFPDSPKPSAEVQAAWIQAGANPDNRRGVWLSPLEIAQIMDAYHTPGEEEARAANLIPRYPMQQRSSMI